MPDFTDLTRKTRVFDCLSRGQVPWSLMVNETATALTEAELKTANTTGQPWRQVSERIGFNTDEPGEPDTCDRSLGGKLATYAELQDPNTSVSRCGKKLFVFCEKRRDTRD